MQENQDVACFLVTKHSWKGKYKRVFSVGTEGITTYNPATFEVTNQWPYEDVYNVQPSQKAGSIQGEFVITMRQKNKKSDTMRFSSEHMTAILTRTLQYRAKFGESRKDYKRWNAFKHHWSDNRVSIVLEAGDAALRQISPSGACISQYPYKDIEEFLRLKDYPGGFCVVIGQFRRLHLFASTAVDDVINTAVAVSSENLGIGIKVNKEAITYEQFCLQRLGKFSTDQHITSVVEFVVQKITPKHRDPVRRMLCLSETCLLERDPASYSVVTIRPLSQIHGIVREENNPQLFTIEYITGARRTYTSTERDNLLASLLDGVRASGNNDIHVQMYPSDAQYRLVPWDTFLDEEAESQHVRLAISPPAGMKLFEAVRRFNVNIPYSGLTYSVTQDGLFAENKEKLIVACAQTLVDLDEKALADVTVYDWEQLFHMFHRLFASKAGFHAFTEVPKLREKLGNKIVQALKLNNEAVNHAAIDTLCALLQPMHANYELRQEQNNKSSLLSSKKFLEYLLDILGGHVVHNTGTLVIASMLDFLTYALCVPYSETTLGDQFNALLEIVAAKGRVLYKLFQYPSMTIVKGAGLVMRAVIEESDAQTSAQMQELALSEGALLRHLHTALFTQSKDVRMLTNRQLSRHLVSLWVTENEAASALLKRVLPRGLLEYLDSKDAVPIQEEDLVFIRNNLSLAQGEGDQKRNVVLEQVQEQWDQVQRVLERRLDNLLQHWRLSQNLNILRKEDKSPKPVVLRKRRERVKSEKNWKLFYYQFGRDHSKSNLIWNYKTREELREALESELRAFTADRDLAMSVNIAWNHAEFEVNYASLANEVKIGDYYLRLLLEEDKSAETPTPVMNPGEFFNEVYHHFLLSAKVQMRCLCLQALTVIYSRYAQDIGPFADTKYVVAMLERCTDFMERDRLVEFISKLIMNKHNCKEVIVANGLAVLVDLLTLAHLHTSRAHVPTQTIAIEASPEINREGAAKEWFYSTHEGERLGPLSFPELKDLYKTGAISEKCKVWAQGLDGWRSLQAVTQLRWTLTATGSAVLNESDLAVLILNMLLRMCDYYPSRDTEGCVIRPVPKVKRLLSEPMYLPHLVQLLLTFDPIIVEKTATLLYLIMQDNPTISRLYLNGVFFFIMMYTGSNILPVAQFLHYTHSRQAFRSNVAKSDFIQRSVVGPILPEAAIFYLENYGPEKYAEVFLGEFDNPEVIWNSEMRRQMIEKIAAHVADFSCRLPSNVRALYQYCPIPAIVYHSLENELFCHMYYLSHLCDTTRYPDWPISDPVAFLKACLIAWHEEVEKKAPEMSIDDACQILNVTLEQYQQDEAVTRKAYFKLAQKYHPDKNPEGRDMFEKINAAYEFLCSRASRASVGPDPERIMLCIRAQTIVYTRYSEDLAPYKYAGYTQLIKTIRLETQDDTLFSKGVPLLAAASELCYHTILCSALNAEQLRREQGLEALQEAFTRCVAVLSRSSLTTDLAVQVCANVCRCYGTAAQFSACREKLSTFAGVFADLCRCMYFKQLSNLRVYAVQCVGNLSVCTALQTQLFQAGVLWHLLPCLFQYDFTLDEGGVQKTETSNQQELANKLARVSAEACACLAGYRQECPEHDGVQNALLAMLTPYVNRLLRECPLDHVLKVLNSNTENPYLIWDNATRAELADFVEKHRTSSSKSSELFGAEFKFSVYEKELIVGNIFVRVYNEQPNFPLENPKGFCIDLLDFLNAQAQYLHSLMTLSAKSFTKPQADQSVTVNGHATDALPPAASPTPSNQRLRHVEMCLQALCNVLRAYHGVEMQCIGHYKLLFSILMLGTSPALQEKGLDVIALCATNQECVSDMAASGVLVYLFLVMPCLPHSLALILSTLNTLMSDGRMVKDTLNLGGLLYVLDVLCAHEEMEIRAAAAELLAKMINDRLSGPRCRLILLNFLPPIFIDAMRDSPTACVQLFEGTTENPELIWNDDTRQKVCVAVHKLKMQQYKRQRENPESTWKLPENFACVYEDVVRGELVVGGVFLRLFIDNPSWVLRNPKPFLTELTEVTMQEMRAAAPQEEKLETLSTAMVALLQYQPMLCEQIAAQGYLPQFCDAMRSRQSGVARASILIMQQLTRNQMCVEQLSTLECLPGLEAAMRQRPDLLLHAAQALRAMFEKDNTPLVGQAVRCKLVDFLLVLLGSSLSDTEQPAAVKAELVKCLKAMSLNLEHGEKVTKVLEASAVWAEFRDQKHDLFLTSTPMAGYLTGGAGVAGYLTSGAMSQQRSHMLPPS